jgi:hypothetical protein
MSFSSRAVQFCLVKWTRDFVKEDVDILLSFSLFFLPTQSTLFTRSVKGVRGVSGEGDMSVTLNTTFGALTIELFFRDTPLTCRNFVELCKAGYYDGCIFHVFLSLSFLPFTSLFSLFFLPDKT